MSINKKLNGLSKILASQGLGDWSGAILKLAQEESKPKPLPNTSGYLNDQKIKIRAGFKAMREDSSETEKVLDEVIGACREGNYGPLNSIFAEVDFKDPAFKFAKLIRGPGLPQTKLNIDGLFLSVGKDMAEQSLGESPIKTTKNVLESDRKIEAQGIADALNKKIKEIKDKRLDIERGWREAGERKKLETLNRLYEPERAKTEAKADPENPNNWRTKYDRYADDGEGESRIFVGISKEEAEAILSNLRERIQEIINKDLEWFKNRTIEDLKKLEEKIGLTPTQRALAEQYGIAAD